MLIHRLFYDKKQFNGFSSSVIRDVYFYVPMRHTLFSVMREMVLNNHLSHNNSRSVKSINFQYLIDRSRSYLSTLTLFPHDY